MKDFSKQLEAAQKLDPCLDAWSYLCGLDDGTNTCRSAVKGIEVDPEAGIYVEYMTGWNDAMKAVYEALGITDER